MTTTRFEKTGQTSKQLLTTKEAAEFLGLSTQTLYNWRCSRRGPDYVLMGSAPRYEVEALNQFIDRNRIRLSA